MTWRHFFCVLDFYTDSCSFYVSPVFQLTYVHAFWEVIQLLPQEDRKNKGIAIDLTTVDSEDEEEMQLKSNTTNKRDSSNQTWNSAAGSRFQWTVITESVTLYGECHSTGKEDRHFSDFQGIQYSLFIKL